jgi:hypothetical protein
MGEGWSNRLTAFFFFLPFCSTVNSSFVLFSSDRFGSTFQCKKKVENFFKRQLLLVKAHDLVVNL